MSSGTGSLRGRSKVSRDLRTLTTIAPDNGH